MSGIEVLAAIGLASNIVGFIETAQKIYRSANDNFSSFTNEFRNVNDLTGRLREHIAAVARGAEGSIVEEDQRLLEIAKQCQTIAQDLVDVLQKYEVRDSKFRSIAVVGKAIRATWDKSKIRDMESLLDKYYRQLMSHLVFSCRSRLDGLSEDTKKSALNTVELLRSSEAHRQDVHDGLGRINLGVSELSEDLNSVETKIDNIHAILSRPVSPVPNYYPTSQPYPVIIDPNGQLEAQSMPLHQAALRSDAKSIYKALRTTGVSINARDEDGQTALHICTMSGDTEFVKGLLCEDNLDINAMDNERRTPLHHAVKNQLTEIVHLLLQGGARQDIADADRKVAIDYAEHDSSIQWMLSHGCDQDAKDQALLFFAQRNDTNGVEDMLRLGARDVAKSTNGSTALMYAALNRNIQGVKSICQSSNASLNDTNKDGKTALIAAAINGDLEVAEALIGGSIDLEVKDVKEGRSALFHALVHAHGEEKEAVDSRWAIASALFKAGADIETTDKNYFNPLLLFCRMGKFPAVQWLVTRGANLDYQKAGNTWTPLMEAALCGDDIDGACKSIDYLIDNGADTELWNKKMGFTALWEASNYGRVAQVKKLLARGAHVNTMSKRGRLPLAIACEKGYEKIVEVLLESGSYVKTRDAVDRMPINYASAHGSSRCVELLIAYKSPISVQDENLNTPLHDAARKGNPEMLLLLLRHGAAPNLTNKEGETALHLACKLKESRCADLLLQHGASASVAKTTTGYTPLDEASTRGVVGTIKALLGGGADPNSRSSRVSGVDEYTPLMHAALHGHIKACEILVAAGADVSLLNSNGETAYQIARRYPRVQSYLAKASGTP